MAAVTGTGSLAVGGVLTLGAPSGGVYLVGASFTNAAITEPATPAPVITSQLTGSTGLAGTYQTNLSQLITSSTFTFSLWEQILDFNALPDAPVFTGAIPASVVANRGSFVPPAPLPGNPPSSNTTSYST